MMVRSNLLSANELHPLTYDPPIFAHDISTICSLNASYHDEETAPSQEMKVQREGELLIREALESAR